MWNSIVVTNNKISDIHIKKIISGEKSAIIIKKFYEKENCKKIIEKINSTNIENDSKKFNHIGPFLMNYTTKKGKYFQNAKKANMIFKKIFLNVDNPINKIKVVISKVYPNYEISETKENRMNYALCTIRRHEKGKKVPLHKDNVTYEGIEYNVSKIDNQNGKYKLPHIGWNQINIVRHSKIFENIENDSHMYFVHSYEFIPEDKNVISATTDYSSKIVCAIEKENIFGTQFHPEKSDKIGLQIIHNFINL